MSPRKGDKAIHIWLPTRKVKMIRYLAVDWEMTLQEATSRLLDEALERYEPMAQRNALLPPDPEGEG